MTFLCLIHDGEDKIGAMSRSESGVLIEGYFAFTEDVRRSGQMARTIQVRKRKVSTTDGPFAETKEQLGGSYLPQRPGPERGHGGGVEEPAGASGER